MMKYKKNLLVIGNGFDLSLGLKSRFQDYIYNKGTKRLIESKKALKELIHLFNAFSCEFNKLTRNLMNNDLSNNIKINMNRQDSNINSNPIMLFLSNNYLNIKYILPDFKLDLGLFKNPVFGVNFVKINKILDNLYKRYKHRLKRCVSHIHVNIWELLILSYEIQYKNSTYKNWYDVENIIKVCITSVLDQQITLNKNINNSQYNYNKNGSYEFNKFTQYFHYNDSMDSLFKSALLITDTVSFINDLSFAKPKNKLSKASFIFSIMSQNHQYDNILFYNALSINKAFQFENVITYIILNTHFFRKNSEYLSCLRNQLSLFERHFNKYLVKTINNYGYKKYINRSYDLLCKLSNNANFNVLDFNYTPVKVSKDNYVRHIHGTLSNKESPIIIGIANKDIWNINSNSDYIRDELYTFSKAYQIMNLSKINNQISNVFFENVKNIIFFGHSFNYNDYAYFEALFDKFNLYSSNVKLIFCYIKHGNKSINTIKNNQVKSVIKLLEWYGHSMTNKEHGNNLISKLLLDNRIKFKNITNDLNN